MNLLESIRIAARGLTANKVRSVLTMLGIIIGVGAVITLVSVGQGVGQSMTERFQSMGTNLLFIRPGGREGPPGMGRSSEPLTMGDVEAVAGVPNITAVAPELDSGQTVVRGANKLSVRVGGVMPDYQDVRNFHVQLGSFISQNDYTQRNRVAVLGSQTRADFFPDNAYPIGQAITINKVSFKVIGVMEEKGGTGMGSQDEVILVPLSTMQVRLAPERKVGGEYTVSTVYVQVASESVMDKATEDITALLRKRHKLAAKDDNDFSIMNQAEMLQTAESISGTLTFYLGAIAAISLLVGGIGIMNIMLVSVTERTREIGLRKAVGARRSDILLQFLVEAMVLSMIGGFIGIGLGLAGSRAVAQLAQISTVVSAGAVLLATGFSAAVGLFFGIYPATRAARLHPIDALRYE
jgi:putative ABC transport system permease protein